MFINFYPKYRGGQPKVNGCYLFSKASLNVICAQSCGHIEALWTLDPKKNKHTTVQYLMPYCFGHPVYVYINFKCIKTSERQKSFLLKAYLWIFTLKV